MSERYLSILTKTDRVAFAETY